MRNRLVMINCEPDVTQWCHWAMDNKIAPTVTAFLRWRPELLISKEIPGEGARTIASFMGGNVRNSQP